mmetsp:Transcript_62380/g.168270  ORF Transcript_62380/g.168270 Transcript_62380/m.168270 type:complete len:200 (+) Transcript_62380:120-719(+)
MLGWSMASWFCTSASVCLHVPLDKPAVESVLTATSQPEERLTATHTPPDMPVPRMRFSRVSYLRANASPDSERTTRSARTGGSTSRSASMDSLRGLAVLAEASVPPDTAVPVPASTPSLLGTSPSCTTASSELCSGSPKASLRMIRTVFSPHASTRRFGKEPSQRISDGARPSPSPVWTSKYLYSSGMGPALACPDHTG